MVSLCQPILGLTLLRSSRGIALKEDEIVASYDAYQDGEVIKIEGLRI
jgi:hypothetical protein